MTLSLEAITEQFIRISQSYNNESPEPQTSFNPKLRAELAGNTALIYARLLPSALGVLELWTKNTEGRMRDGINKNHFQILIAKGVKILHMCQELIETATCACEQAETLGESLEATESRKLIVEARVPLEALRSKTLTWKKMVDRQPPEIDLASIEQGAEEIRQGKFKTPEQVLEAIRATKQ